MEVIFLLGLFVFTCSGVFADVSCPMHCENPSAAAGVVESYCATNDTGKMVGRCCIAQNSTNIVGLDLTNCGISNLNISGIEPSHVEIIDLQDNKLNNLTTAEFRGLLNLKTLYLPFMPNIKCPGGDKAWKDVWNMNFSYIECETQTNPCHYLNVSCTVNGECLHMGPGSAKCVCKPGQYGYKCLQRGTFPTTTYCTSLIIPTLVISGFTWYYLRKHVTITRKYE